MHILDQVDKKTGLMAMVETEIRYGLESSLEMLGDSALSQLQH